MNDAALSLLKNLLAMPTPSGWEYDGLKLLADYVAPAAAKTEFDVHDNLRAVMNPGAPVKVMIEGHCDEIGFMVQYVDEKGFLTMCAVGGVTVPLLAGERIVIKGRNGPVNGVFGVRPPHLMKAEERNKVAPQAMEDITVDIGASSKKEALELVELGAPAVIDAGWRPLAGDRVACRGFDDRIGAFIVAEAFKRLHKEKLNIELHMVASVQEELGLIGARTAAYDIFPHAGICVDVGFASDTPGNDVKLVGEAKLGEGPLMVFGPTYNEVLRTHIEKQAELAKIPLQRQVRARGDGTNAMAMRLARGGVAVALVGMPLRYMHSAVETLSMNDVENTIEVLRLALLNMPANISFKR